MLTSKHSYASLPRKSDYQTDTQIDGRMDRQTDAGQSDPYVPLCFAGDTKSKDIFVYYCGIHFIPETLFLYKFAKAYRVAKIMSSPLIIIDKVVANRENKVSTKLSQRW